MLPNLEKHHIPFNLLNDGSRNLKKSGYEVLTFFIEKCLVTMLCQCMYFLFSLPEMLVNGLALRALETIEVRTLYLNLLSL